VLVETGSVELVHADDVVDEPVLKEIEQPEGVLHDIVLLVLKLGHLFDEPPVGRLVLRRPLVIELIEIPLLGLEMELRIRDELPEDIVEIGRASCRERVS
jgi:hypothetical protein